MFSIDWRANQDETARLQFSKHTYHNGHILGRTIPLRVDFSARQRLWIHIAFLQSLLYPRGNSVRFVFAEKLWSKLDELHLPGLLETLLHLQFLLVIPDHCFDRLCQNGEFSCWRFGRQLERADEGRQTALPARNRVH